MSLSTPNTSDLKDFCVMACEFGGSEAKIIPTNMVEVADWVRMKCQFGCGGYGKRLTCPPYSPTPDQTRAILRGFNRAILLRFDPESPDYDWKKTHSVVVKLEREVFWRGYHKTWAFACGPCPLCDKCNLKACIHPEEARPSMEASGIDVFTTVRKAGFEIHVLRTYDDSPKYFSLLLVD